jgi:NRPS condensation-like uncharacterized protein
VSRGAHRAPASRDAALPRRRFGVIDEVSCYFDTDDEPANIHLELRLGSRLDPGAVRSAAAAALLANPRASSRRSPRGPLNSNYWWEHPARLDIDPVSSTTFTDATDLASQREAFIAKAPSVDHSPPARILVANGPGCCHLILNAHHATMDGLSWFEVLRDIGRRYASAVGDDAAGRTDMAGAAAAAGKARPASALTGPAASAAARPNEPDTGQPLATPARTGLYRPSARIAAEGGGRRGCGLHVILLPGVPHVLPAEAGVRTTVNDALITALIATVGRWNAERRRPRRPVRITTPVNTRAPGDLKSAGHLARLVTISALPPATDADLGPLLLDVASQTRRARQTSSPQVSSGTRGIAAIPCPTSVKRWLVRAALRTAGPLICDTIMLTNIGNVPDPPDFGTDSSVTLALSGPAQMPRGLSLAVATGGGQPLLAFRFNRALLSDAAVRDFAEQYVRVLEILTDIPARAGALNPDWSGQAGSVAGSVYERR